MDDKKLGRKLSMEELDNVTGGTQINTPHGGPGGILGMLFGGDDGGDGFVGNTGDGRLREVYEQSQNRKTGMA